MFLEIFINVIFYVSEASMQHDRIKNKNKYNFLDFKVWTPNKKFIIFLTKK